MVLFPLFHEHEDEYVSESAIAAITVMANGAASKMKDFLSRDRGRCMCGVACHVYMCGCMCACVCLCAWMCVLMHAGVFLCMCVYLCACLIMALSAMVFSFVQPTPPPPQHRLQAGPGSPWGHCYQDNQPAGGHDSSS